MPDCLFLDHDSHLECGDPLELDDSIVDQALERRGVIGQLPVRHVPAILDHLNSASYTSQSDRDQIFASLLQFRE